MQEIIKKNGGVDLFSLDAQHRPNSDERELVRFCKTRGGIGSRCAASDLQHPKLAYLTGATRIWAYLPSWFRSSKRSRQSTRPSAISTTRRLATGAGVESSDIGEKPPADRLQYSQWWNGNGLLGFQIETLRGALNARNIVKPGIDWISWGPGDMAFDLERHSNSPFKTLDEVHGYVIQQLKGYDVRLPAT